MASSKTASRAKARGAVARSATFHGLKLEVPAKLPGTLAFDLADLEDAEGFGPTKRLLVSLLGEEQTKQVRAVIEKKNISLDKVADELVKLIDSILEASGTDPGK